MNNILQIVFVVVISVLIYIFYNEDNRHYLRNMFYSHRHKKENFINQRLQPIKNLPKLDNDNLKSCVTKLKNKNKENNNSNESLYMFNLDELKNKEINSRTKNIATLNCKYWDLDNDGINTSLVPKPGELFIA